MADNLIFRVFQIPEDLRTAVNESRSNQHQTLRAFLGAAIQQKLPQLVQQLQEILPSLQTDRRPIRLPFSADLLEQLRTASEATGRPSTRLLLTALARACQASSQPRRKTQAAAPRDEQQQEQCEMDPFHRVNLVVQSVSSPLRGDFQFPEGEKTGRLLPVLRVHIVSGRFKSGHSWARWNEPTLLRSLREFWHQFLPFDE